MLLQTKCPCRKILLRSTLHYYPIELIVLNLSEGLITALLPAGNHPTNINVAAREDLPGFVDGGGGEGACAPQDPGKVHVEQTQDVGAGIDQR